MKITVVGIEHVDYISKKTNEQVTGVKLYTSDKSESTRIQGNITREFFISSKKACCEIAKRIPINTAVEVYFDNFRNIDAVIIPEPVGKK